MARRVATKKIKKVRISKSAANLLDEKYMGDEPTFVGKMSNLDYIKALNWYNYMYGYAEAKSFIVDLLKSLDRDDEARAVAAASDYSISTTAGWVARMMTRGLDLPDSAYAFFENKLSSIGIKKAQVKETKREVVDIQAATRERARDIIGDIEEMLDKTDKNVGLYDWLKKREIPSRYSTDIISHFQPWLDELKGVMTGGDRQLDEAYSRVGVEKIVSRIDQLEAIIDDAHKYGQVVKKIRATRKPRPVSKEKLLRGLKYMKQDDDYKLASAEPKNIIGAEELWLLNTKYKVLTVLRAKDRAGLSVKGTSIVNYDEGNSRSKGLGRSSSKIIDSIREAGKRVLSKTMNELKTDKPLQYRSNENTIILKVILG